MKIDLNKTNGTSPPTDPFTQMEHLPGLKEENVSLAFDVSEEDTDTFLNSRADWFASLGVERESIERLLAEQAQKFCAGGKQLTSSERGREMLHKLAFNPCLKLADASFFSKGFKNSFSTGPVLSAPVTRRRLLIEAVGMFPDSLPATEAYDRLEQALAATEFTLDRKTNSGQRVARKARAAAGFKARNIAGQWFWIRLTNIS
jgi:hypothetical protein